MSVEDAKAPQIAEVRSGGSYLSHNDMRLHFGLGQRQDVPPIKVRWPDGATERFEGLKVNTIQVIRQGTGRAAASSSR